MRVITAFPPEGQSKRCLFEFNQWWCRNMPSIPRWQLGLRSRIHIFKTSKKRTEPIQKPTSHHRLITSKSISTYFKSFIAIFFFTQNYSLGNPWDQIHANLYSRNCQTNKLIKNCSKLLMIAKLLISELHVLQNQESTQKQIYRHLC